MTDHKILRWIEEGPGPTVVWTVVGIWAVVTATITALILVATR